MKVIQIKVNIERYWIYITHTLVIKVSVFSIHTQELILECILVYLIKIR